MHQHDVRQVPVYEKTSFRGILTAQTLARWLAARLASGIGLVEEEPVGSILEFRADGLQHEVADHRSIVTDAFNLMEKHYHIGRPLRAIILTPRGQPSELPTGIVTSGDFPVMLESVGL